MSFKRFVPLVALIAIFAMALRFSIGADTYWHLRVGEWILSEGELPRIDPFSLTRLGDEWIYPGWLAQVMMILVHRVLGFPGLNLLTALAVTATFGLVWATMREEPLLRAFVLLFAATVSAVYWAARPHIFTMLFAAITLWSLAKFRENGSRVVWIIPPLAAVWANVHGGFAIAILLIGLEATSALLDLLLPKLRIAIKESGVRKGAQVSVDGESSHRLTDDAASDRLAEHPEDTIGEAAAEVTDEPFEPSYASDAVMGHGGIPAMRSGSRGSPIQRLKILAGVGLASLGAILLNPFGAEMLIYPFRTVSIEVLQNYIQEWQSPNFHQLEVQPFLWMLLLLLISMAASPKRPTTIELLHVGLFAYIGFMAARNIPLFALVAAPVLSRHLGAVLDEWLPARGARTAFSPRIANVLNIVFVVLLSIAALGKGALPLSTQFNRDTITESMPAQAIGYIRTNQPDGPLLNSYNWGGYVLWNLYPDYLSFVDGRTDLFDDEILEEYLDIWRGSAGWDNLIRKWGIQTVLIESDAPLADELERAGWKIAYTDDQATVFTVPE